MGLLGLASNCNFGSPLSTAPAFELIRVLDDGFSPDTQYISPGGRVRWEWAGDMEHNVTWQEDSGQPADNSPTQKTGEMVRLFESLGTYRYYCSIHHDSAIVKVIPPIEPRLPL
jgi:plastocyanin